MNNMNTHFVTCVVCGGETVTHDIMYEGQGTGKIYIKCQKNVENISFFVL